MKLTATFTLGPEKGRCLLLGSLLDQFPYLVCVRLFLLLQALADLVLAALLVLILLGLLARHADKPRAQTAERESAGTWKFAEHGKSGVSAGT